MAERLFRAHRRRVAPVLIATTIAVIALGASPALADTGSVYFDDNNNAAAGETNLLFNATFTGTDNVGLGRSVMPNLTDGSSNVATGSLALDHNTTGDNNDSTGTAALFFNTSGDFNTATGASSLLSNFRGNKNVAAGFGALNTNTTGDRNVAAGYSALHSNSTGNVNVAIGTGAGQNLTTGSDNIDIANSGKAGEAGAIWIGNPNRQARAFIAGINGTTLGGAAQPVLVKPNGQLGTASTAAAKASASKPLSAAVGRRLLATVQR